MSTTQFDRIVEKGTGFGRAAKSGLPSNMIRCADGVKLSVIGNYGAYCTPRPAFNEPNPAEGFTHLEVGFPSVRPEPWEKWEELCESPESPTDTVYGYVPVELIREFIESHGGEQ